MTKQTPADSTFSNLMHIGILVKDADQTVKRLESFGIGPFAPMTEKPLFQDKPEGEKPKGFLAKIGDVEIEVFDPPKGEPLFKEFRANKGEGIHHLGFLVHDIDKEVAKLAQKDLKKLTKGTSESVEWVDYDSGIGGSIFQLIKRK